MIGKCYSVISMCPMQTNAPWTTSSWLASGSKYFLMDWRASSSTCTNWVVNWSCGCPWLWSVTDISLNTAGSNVVDNRTASPPVHMTVEISWLVLVWLLATLTDQKLRSGSGPSLQQSCGCGGFKQGVPKSLKLDSWWVLSSMHMKWPCHHLNGEMYLEWLEWLHELALGSVFNVGAKQRTAMPFLVVDSMSNISVFT